MTDRPFLLDLNVLIALTWPNHVHHRRAQSWFGSIDAPWATTPMTEAGFLRLSTNEHVVGDAATMTEALSLLGLIRSLPRHIFIADGSSLGDPEISLSGLTTAKQVTVVHLVNATAANGAVLATLDKSILTYLEAVDRKHVLLIP